MDNGDLGGVHGNAVAGDDVVEVGDGLLEEEAVLSQQEKHDSNVTEMLGSRVAVDEDVVEEDEDEATE